MFGLLVCMVIAIVALVLGALAFSKVSKRGGSKKCGPRGRRGCAGSTGSAAAANEFMIPLAAGPLAGLSSTTSSTPFAAPIVFAGIPPTPFLYPPDDTLGAVGRASFTAPTDMTLSAINVSLANVVSIGLVGTGTVRVEVWVSPACSGPYALSALAVAGATTTVSTDLCLNATATTPVALSANDRVVVIVSHVANAIALLNVGGISGSILASIP